MGFPETFKALSDPIRREILVMLRENKMSAGEISEKFNMTNATISYHLSQLKKADSYLKQSIRTLFSTK
ncbi:bacterial regulatory, arsR family protein [Clostridioides difficile P64]|nr:metalloregulator ArsR/SmtB family transcription factor [Clostridioides difficile]ERM37925.1 bacterial regulatory, arsR family protein [Clostridioides difficile P64]